MASIMKVLRPILILVLAWTMAIPFTVEARPKANIPNPDFTKGDPIPEGAKHDWNLGATGARGWIYSNPIYVR